MNVTLVMFKDDKRRDFPLNSDKVTLGRGPEATLRIPLKDVSRKHCEIVYDRDEEEIIVRDLGSTNGTYLNGKRIAEKELNPGDQLQVGPVVFIAQVDGRPKEVSKDDVKPRATTTSDDSQGVLIEDDETEAILDLDDEDFDFEDAISSVELIEDDEDEQKK